MHDGRTSANFFFFNDTATTEIYTLSLHDALPIRSLAAPILIALPGCGVSPSVNILGSFFPAWLMSIVIGVVLTVVVRQLFVAIDVASHLRPAGLVYPCLGGLLILATWLILFGS